MAELPTIAFDTSAINAAERGRARGKHLMIALRCGFDIRLPAATADEVLSTPDGAHRESLLGICEKLVRFGRCLWPPHEIIRLLVSEHFTNPAQFDWTRVNVRARIYETAIIQRDFTEELCAEQRQEQFKTQNGFDKMWKPLRP